MANKPENKLDETTSETELEELSIMELDERLEFVAWCDNCSCPPPPKEQTP